MEGSPTRRVVGKSRRAELGSTGDTPAKPKKADVTVEDEPEAMAVDSETTAVTESTGGTSETVCEAGVAFESQTGAWIGPPLDDELGWGPRTENMDLEQPLVMASAHRHTKTPGAPEQNRPSLEAPSGTSHPFSPLCCFFRYDWWHNRHRNTRQTTRG